MGMRPQEWPSLGTVNRDRSCTVYANERSSSIIVGLDYYSTVMLTCKLLFAAAKAIVDVGPHIPCVCMYIYICMCVRTYHVQ